MEVNFLNQNPWIPSWLGVFQFDIYLLIVVLSKSMCISTFGLSSSPSNSFFIFFPFGFLKNLPFWFIFTSCIVISSCVAFSFLSLQVPASFLCFIILACFRRYFICLSNRISHRRFDFFSCFLRGSKFSHKLTSPLHRLVHSILLYYSLIYKVELDLFFRFRLNCSPFYVSLWW